MRALLCIGAALQRQQRQTRLQQQVIKTHMLLKVGSQCVCVCVYKYHSLRLSLSSPLLSSIQSFLSRLFLLPFFPAPKVRLCDIITVLPALVMMWKWRRGKYSWHLPLTLVWLHRCYHGYTWPVFVGCCDAPQQLFACQGALYCKLFNGLLN